MRTLVISAALVALSCAYTLAEEKKELYRINNRDNDSVREETGYLVDGSLVVIGMYEFNGDDGFVHSTSFIADKNGYRAKVSQRPIGATPEQTSENWLESGLGASYGGSAGSYGGGDLSAVDITSVVTSETTASTPEPVTVMTSEVPQTTSVDSLPETTQSPYFYLPPASSPSETFSGQSEITSTDQIPSIDPRKADKGFQTIKKFCRGGKKC